MHISVTAMAPDSAATALSLATHFHSDVHITVTLMRTSLSVDTAVIALPVPPLS